MKHFSSSNQIAATYRQYLYKLSSTPVTYITGVVVVLFAVLQFFIGQQFFTDAGTSDLHHFFSAIPYVSIIAIPAVTFLVPFRNDELEYPVHSLILVLGKLFALATFFICFMLLTVVVPVAVSFFGTPEVSQILCGYFGMAFYLLAAISLSLCISSVITSPAGSFLVTALALAATNSAHLVPLYMNVPNGVASFFRSVSFAWHFDAAGKGIIDTRDIVFYLTISIDFILLTTLMIERKRGEQFSFRSERSAFVTKTAILCLVATCFVFMNNTSFYKRFDTTHNKKFTVTEYSKTLLSEVQEPLTITYYRSQALQQLYPQVRDVKDYLDEYASVSKECSLTVLDPSKEGVAERLSKYGISAQQIQTAGRDSTSYLSVYSAIIIEYLEKTEIIPFVLDTSTLEYDLTSRISSLIRNTKRTVQVVVGNGLSLDSDYSYVTPWLESQGFIVSPLTLPLQIETSLPLLVIGTNAFTSEDCEALEQFIVSGGKTFIATTPYTVNISGDWSVTVQNDKVCKLLNSFGLVFKQTLTADISNFRITMYSDTNSDGSPASETRTEYTNYPLWPVLRPQTNALNGMTVFWPCALSFEQTALSPEDTFEPLLVTSTSSWQVQKTEGAFQTNPFTFPQKAEQSDEKGPFTIAACFTGAVNGYYTTGKGTANGLVVFGDQYAFSTMMLNYTASQTGDFRSLDFLADELLKMQGQQAILELKNRNYVTTSLYKVSSKDLFSYRIPVLAATCIIPLLLLLFFGLLFYFVRKREYSFEQDKKLIGRKTK